MIEIPTPLELPPATVKSEWIDFNGHMNVAYYLLAMDEASETLDELLQLSYEYRETTSNGTFAGDIHISYLREVKEGDPLRMTGRVIECDTKRVHCWIEMYHATSGFLAATMEKMVLHVDMSERRVAPMAPDHVTWIKQVRDAHSALPLPDGLGKVMRIPT